MPPMVSYMLYVHCLSVLFVFLGVLFCRRIHGVFQTCIYLLSGRVKTERWRDREGKRSSLLGFCYDINKPGKETFSFLHISISVRASHRKETT